MLDSSHVRFTPEVEYIAIITLTYVYSYLIDWLVLRDVLNTSYNIMSATYKRGGWVGGGGVGGWVNNVSRHSWPVVCMVGQKDGHSSPDHATRWADVEWNGLGLPATISMPPSGPTRSVLVSCDLKGLVKSCL